MKNFIKNLVIISLIILFSVLPVFGQDDFSSFMESEEGSVLEWSGKGILNTRYNLDYNNPPDSKIDVYPEIDLNLDYIGERSEFHGKIDFSDYSSTNPEQLIKEAYFQLYYNKFIVELGYMKLIWGKGDGIFTFDNLNAVDYTDFINKNYIDQKIPEAMIKLNFPFGMQGLVEAVYTPVFTSNIYPEASKNWNQTAYNIISTPNTRTLADGQLGLRFTNSFAGIDFGASYQYTFLRESLTNTAVLVAPFESWDRVHLFGAETAFVVAAFNIWAEAAYYMTLDFAGDDPNVHNNRFIYLLGFSRDIMIHNISLNIQVQSKLKLNEDGISGISDIDYESDGVYSSSMLTAGLRDSFLNEKITSALNGSYSIEDRDFMISPELTINIIEDTWLNLKYSFFYGDSDTIFGQFKDNDFLEIRMEYSF